MAEEWSMKDTVAPRRLATSRPHESQDKICKAAKRPLFSKTTDFSESLWHPALTKSHGTEKMFVIAKTLL